MRFGKDNLYNESLEKMIPGAIQQVIVDYDLSAIGAPSLKVLNMREGEPLVCEAAFELSPEVALPELGDIEVEKARPKVTDEMVDDAVEAFKRRHSTWNSVDRPAGENDRVSITSVAKGESPRTEDVDLAAPDLDRELRNILLGKSEGDRTFFEINRDSQEKIRYDITVYEVKERVFPEMTPEFFRRVLGTGTETEEAFREKVRNLIYNQTEKDNLSYAGKSAFDAVVARADLEIPDSLLTRQIELAKRQDADDCRKRHNISMEEYLRAVSITSSQYEQQLRVQSTQILRRALVLDALAAKFDIEVDNKDLGEEIAALAFVQRADPAKFRAAFQKDKKLMDQLTADLRYQKVVRAVLANVKMNEVDIIDTPKFSDTPSENASPEIPDPSETPTEISAEAPFTEVTEEGVAEAGSSVAAATEPEASLAAAEGRE
jgi:trigger factor